MTTSASAIDASICKRRRHHGADATREDLVEVAHPVDRAVEDRHLRAEADRDDRRVVADDRRRRSRRRAPARRPGTPPSSRPRPPSGFSRKYAPACAASRPAISLIGARSGSRRSSVSTVSYATAVTPLSTSARVSGSSAAMCRYVKSTSPSRRRGYSDRDRLLHLQQQLGLAPHVRPARRCARPRARSRCRGTRCPRLPSSRRAPRARAARARARPPVSARRGTRRVLISLATPIRKTRGTLSGCPSADAGRGAGPRASSRPRARRAVASISSTRQWTSSTLLVVVRVGLAGVDALGEVDVHPLAAEAGRRPEGGELTSTSPPVRPHSSCSSRFAVASGSSPSSHVPAGSSSSSLRAASRSCRTSQTRSLAVDGDDRDRSGMLDDLPLAVPPALDRDVDQLAVVDACATRRASRASRSTSARSSGPNHGGDPAAAFSRRPLRPRGRGNRDVDALVREHPLEQRLRPRLDAEARAAARARRRSASAGRARPRRAAA